MTEQTTARAPLPRTLSRSDYEARARALGVEPRTDAVCEQGHWTDFDASSAVGYAHLQIGRVRGHTVMVEARDRARCASSVVPATPVLDATRPTRTVLLTRNAPSGTVVFSGRQYLVASCRRWIVTDDCPSYLGAHLHGCEGLEGWLVDLVPPTPVTTTL